MNKYFAIIFLANLFIPDSIASSPFIETQSAKEGGYSLVPSWLSNIAFILFIIVSIGYLIKIIPNNIFNSSSHNRYKNQSQNLLSEKQGKETIIENKFIYDDKVFHSEFGFGYVTSTDDEIIEVFFKDDLKKRKVNQKTLKRF